ncbi:hypothetical protein NM208_g2317 [Fusarium decemcellulare]|uniref:Uncharacterized protein n=1 Tax=Fusarium decemcellulare TaxID=57161 RepID=A0ACC1SSZ4_9HYPO|nr:hypothetical protein NM208_g2317 [Fusarium decemcellulare]
MWRMNPQRACMACIGMSRRKVATSTSLQIRTIATRTSGTEPASGKPATSDKRAPLSQKHNPQPTESEADVAADRSRIDPIHRQNPTESQEDVMADRSPDNPLSKAFKFTINGKVVGTRSLIYNLQACPADNTITGTNPTLTSWAIVSRVEYTSDTYKIDTEFARFCRRVQDKASIENSLSLGQLEREMEQQQQQPEKLHALVLGASGISGWSLLNQLCQYPRTDTWHRISGTTNRPFDPMQSGLPSNDRLRVYSGVDLTRSVESIAQMLKDQVDSVGAVTHVFFTAYTHMNTRQERLEVNAKMLENSIRALGIVAPNVRAVILQTGGKGYGLEYPDKVSIVPPLSEDLPRIPPPMGDEVFYYAQYDILEKLSQTSKWTFAEIRPDGIVGFVPGTNPMNMAEGIALYLSVYRAVHGKGSKVPFPGTAKSYRNKHSDTFQDLLSKMEIHVALKDELRTNGPAYNIADEDGPITWEDVWPGICSSFGLVGVAPSGGGQQQSMEDFVKSNRSSWNALCDEFAVRKDRIDVQGWTHTHFMLVDFDFDRWYDLSRTRATGFTESIDTVEAYKISFNRRFESCAIERIGPYRETSTYVIHLVTSKLVGLPWELFEVAILLKLGRGPVRHPGRQSVLLRLTCPDGKCQHLQVSLKVWRDIIARMDEPKKRKDPVPGIRAPTVPRLSQNVLQILIALPGVLAIHQQLNSFDRDDITMSEFEFMELAHTWCLNNKIPFESRLRGMAADGINVGKRPRNARRLRNIVAIIVLVIVDLNDGSVVVTDNLDDRGQSLTRKSFTLHLLVITRVSGKALTQVPTSPNTPALVLNALLSSSILQKSELQQFHLHYPGIKWKRTYDSSVDRLATFHHAVATNLEMFQRTLIVFQPDERLSLAIYIPKKIERSRDCLIDNAEPCVHICKLLTGPSKTTDAPHSTVVLTPYTRQAEVLKRMLSSILRNIEVSSIDGFQGREADIIVFVTVRCNEHRNISFLTDMCRMNVALTRARTVLIVVGNRATLTEGSVNEESSMMWRRLLSRLTEVQLDMPVSEATTRRT